MGSIEQLLASRDATVLRAAIHERAQTVRAVQSEIAQLTGVMLQLERVAAVAAGRSERAVDAAGTALVQDLTGVSRWEARGLVQVGSAMLEPTRAVWMTPVVDAVRDGGVSVGKAETIRAGLGEPSDRVSVEDLTLVTAHLVELAGELTPEQLAVETRARREKLDHQHVVDEERRIQEERSVKLHRKADGSSTLIAKLDREATVLVTELLDQATGPRQAGPRFTSAEGQAFAESVRSDPRRTEQLAHDALVTIVRIGLAADPNRVPGRQPAVRVIVTARDLATGTGYGALEGNQQTVSISTVERAVCSSGTVTVHVDDTGQPLTLGRKQRLFSDTQRTALAIRDGGCRHPGCDRPPSWAEAHHLTPWANGGGTDLNNGILLCRTHHLDLHNRAAHIHRDTDGTFTMIEPDGARRALPSHARIQQRIGAA